MAVTRRRRYGPGHRRSPLDGDFGAAAVGSISAKAITFGPEATATYCVPSNAYVIGDAFQSWLVWNCHSGAPVETSAATSAPLSSPKKTSPPAVASTPPHDVAGPICGSSQRIVPLLTSIARRIFSV